MENLNTGLLILILIGVTALIGVVVYLPYRLSRRKSLFHFRIVDYKARASSSPPHFIWSIVVLAENVYEAEEKAKIFLKKLPGYCEDIGVGITSLASPISNEILICGPGFSINEEDSAEYRKENFGFFDKRFVWTELTKE